MSDLESVKRVMVDDTKSDNDVELIIRTNHAATQLLPLLGHLDLLILDYYLDEPFTGVDVFERLVHSVASDQAVMPTRILLNSSEFETNDLMAAKIKVVLEAMGIDTHDLVLTPSSEYYVVAKTHELYQAYGPALVTTR